MIDHKSLSEGREISFKYCEGIISTLVLLSTSCEAQGGTSRVIPNSWRAVYIDYTYENNLPSRIISHHINPKSIASYGSVPKQIENCESDCIIQKRRPTKTW